MEKLQIQYTNICDLFKFEQSNEFKSHNERTPLRFIEINSFNENVTLIYTLVNDLHSVFPGIKLSSNYIKNGNGNDKIALTLYFSEFIPINEIDDPLEKEKSGFDLQRCQTKELQILYDQLKQKNDIIELFNRQILDSLRYASKLQKAIIPSKEYFSEIFPHHFVIYKPKHIVSGDFFWLHEQANKIYLAVADCTGHGMPGALMSILAITCLNEISNMFSPYTNISAAHILNLLRDKIKKTLHQKGDIDEMKDGLDIGLIILEKDSLKIQFAGAYIPLYIVRDGLLIEHKADKMPIGVHIKDKQSFTNKAIQIIQNDTVYLFTDGYADQFGGPFINKFMKQNLKNLLTKISTKPFAEQKRVLLSTLDVWKNEHDQIDDITAVGIRIEKDDKLNYSI